MAKANRAGLAPGDRKILKSFGKRVAAEREKRALSVYDLTGEDMPIRSRQHWQAIEAGQKNINVTTLFKVARSLKVPIEALIAGVES